MPSDSPNPRTPHGFEPEGSEREGFEHAALELVHLPEGLALRDRSEPRQKPLLVDFLTGTTAHRVKGIGRSKHPLARAVGRRAPLPRILDGTAGLGRDAFVLATLGYEVHAVERHPWLHALLADGVARLRESLPDLALTVATGDCRDAFDPAPEVVYLDPMFPHRGKSALVKKEMRLLQKLLGTPDPDETESRALLEAARAAATDRVVVKRPARAPALAKGCSFTVPGSKVRWDVYLA